MGFRTLVLTGALMLTAAPAWSQTFLPAPPNQSIPPRVTREIDLSGPRFGLTVLSEGTVTA